MKKNRSTAGGTAVPNPSGIPHFSYLKQRLVICGVLAAIAAYWFLFIMGGTFDPARRAALKNTEGDKRTVHILGSKAKPSKQNTRNVAATTKNNAAVLQANRAAERKILLQ